MAGRGRGATLPAWMTNGGGEMPATNGHSEPNAGHSHGSAGQFDDYSSQPPRYAEQYAPPAAHAPVHYSVGSAPPQMDYPRHGGHHDARGRDEGRPTGRDNRDRPRSRSRSKSGATSSVSTGSRIGSWKRGGTRVSNFDVRPVDGIDLPPIGVVATQTGVPNSYFSYANNPAVSGAPLPGSGHGASKYGATPYSQPKVDPNAANMLTRHARRIYAGGIPPRANEVEIANFFNDVVSRALLPTRTDGPPVLKIYLNIEKCYAFVEFGSIELTTACMQLDGIKFEHPTGTTIVRVRRPNDYRPEMLPPSLGPIPRLNLEAVGVSGGTVQNGPGKVFIGGLPYNLTDEQIMELLGAFGPIKSFHQVRDPGSVTSKGYGFCEYVNPANAETAIAGLNGMALGEKTLSVRHATQNQAGGGGGGGGAPHMQQQQMMMGMGGGMPGMGMGMGGMQGMGGMYGGNNMYGGGGGGGGAGLVAPQMGGAGQLVGPPSRVLRLSNMVTRDDLYNEAEYQDIREDVRLECLQYGKVNSVVIPRVKDGYSAAAECLIFVEFDSVEGAASAAKVLNGRKFAENTVVVSYFSEQDFAKQALI